MRTIYVTLALSLIMIAVLIALSASFKKAEKDGIESSTMAVMITTDEELPVMAQTTATTEVHTETTATTVTEAETEHKEEVIALPEFIAPVSGGILKSHSGDTPVFSITMNDYRPHQGVDIAGPMGSDVYAAADGVISEIWEDPMSGNCISIKHEGNAVSIYRNLSPTVPEGIAVGTAVTGGEVIGSIGESSLLEIADESHLHFELMIDGSQVDPANYITFNEADTNYEG